MKHTKRFLSFVLSMILMLTLAMPVMADEHSNHTITINETVAGHTFEAYQIFSGEVASNDGNVVLSNPEWGSGVDDTKSVTWTFDDSTTETLTLLQALQSQKLNPTYYNHYLDDTTAANVVKTLSDFNTSAHADLFAKIVGKYLTDVCTTSKAYKQTGTDTEGNPVYTEVTSGEDITNYQITGLTDGYYLVKENKDTVIQSTTHTDYILQIVQDVTVTPKDGDVTVDKDIIEGGTPVDACANNMGDEVDFKITATLPKNYDEYDEYYLAFADTMSAGLTLDLSNIEVYTLNGDDEEPITSNYYKVYVPASSIPEGNPNGLVAIENYEEGKPNFVVEFVDLTLLSESSEYTVTPSTKIVVKYKAVLNENAVIGGTGNPNNVYLTYSTSPYDEGYGKTPENKVYVFTFKLDVTKVDGKNTQDTTDDETLDGAKFILARERSGHKQYAVLKDSAVSKWTNWVDEADLRDYVETTYAEKTEEERQNTYNNLFATYGVASVMVSENGVFDVKGLDLDTYWLIETEAPAGYNNIDPIQFTIDASYDKTLGRPAKEGETEAKDTLTITIGTDTQPGDTETGTVSTTVINNPGSQLPTTGGIGTKIFYTAGGMLVAAAVVLLVTKKRMSEE